VRRLGTELGHPPGPEDSAEYADQYAALQSQLQSAELQVKNYEKELRRQQDIYDNHPDRLTEANVHLGRLNEVLPVHLQEDEAATKTADASRAQHAIHQDNRDKVIREALQIPESEEGEDNGTTK